MREIDCPSCGARVAIQSSISVLATCAYCQTSVVRNDLNWTTLGRVGELIEDHSAIMLGMQGRYEGVSFQIIGRLQQKYSQGFWNEWRCLFEDSKEGWLSDGAGEFYFTFLHKVPAAPLKSATQKLGLGTEVRIQGKTYHVFNIETVISQGVAGELPFEVNTNEPHLVIDASSDAGFATLDFLTDPATIYLGKSVTLDTLNLTPNITHEKKAIKQYHGVSIHCPQCGAGQKILSHHSHSFCCQNCQSILDVENVNSIAILQKYANAVKVGPTIPLGTLLSLNNISWQVLGFLQRESLDESEPFFWEEYLLFDPKQGYAWLTHSDHHWRLGKSISSQGLRYVKGQSFIPYQQDDFQHFASYSARNRVVLGEFYWKVQVGDACQIHEFIAPPKGLCLERITNENHWSIHEFIPHKIITQALPTITLDKPAEMCDIEPNPYLTARLQSFRYSLIAIAFLLFFQFVIIFSRFDQTLYQQTLEFSPNDQETVSTEPFVLHKTQTLIIQNNTNLDNNWLELDIKLINQTTGQSFETYRSIFYYHGYDEGYWNEGEKKDQAHIKGVPAGRYYLLIENETQQPSESGTDFSPESEKAKVRSELSIKTQNHYWSNFWIALGLFLFGPLWYNYRHARFESQRWQSSFYSGFEKE